MRLVDSSMTATNVRILHTSAKSPRVQRKSSTLSHHPNRLIQLFPSAQLGHLDSLLKPASASRNQCFEASFYLPTRYFSSTGAGLSASEGVSKFNFIPSTSMQDARSNSQSNAHILEPPIPVHGWPTPLVTQEDIDKYFPALYAHEWSVSKHIWEKRDKTGKPTGELIEYAALQTSFHLPSDEPDKTKTKEELDALLNELEEKENHHVERIIGEITFTIRTSTHSAVRLPLASQPDTKKKRMPGITLRDVRFAILLDELVRARFKALELKKIIGDASLQLLSVEALLG
ncbi:hypothetical protein DFH11DRAFT_1722941 [Phellopilus nigrolimitatus]|nr:hypothetical protein DFH11DRAFT_1722941 [Phellopilus nigrolimitatus]